RCRTGSLEGWDQIRNLLENAQHNEIDYIPAETYLKNAGMPTDADAAFIASQGLESPPWTPAESMPRSWSSLQPVRLRAPVMHSRYMPRTRDRVRLIKPVDPTDPAVTKTIADWAHTRGTDGICTCGPSQNTVTAQDSCGTTVPNYTGTIHFTSSDTA